MKVVVLGAGVVGTTSAWYLAQAGHETLVVDRQPEPGLETSFANGGQISVSHAEPWANPAAPLKVLSDPRLGIAFMVAVAQKDKEDKGQFDAPRGTSEPSPLHIRHMKKCCCKPAGDLPGVFRMDERSHARIPAKQNFLKDA